MGFFNDLLSDPFGTIGDVAGDIFGGLDVDWGALAALGGAAAYQSGALDPVLEALGLDFATQAAQVAPPIIGYQGEIPKYEAVQYKIPQGGYRPKPGDPGRRYLTDVIYAQRPEGMTPPTLQEAQRMGITQALTMAGLPVPDFGAAPGGGTGGSGGGTSGGSAGGTAPSSGAPSSGGSGVGTGTLDEGQPQLRAAGGLLGLAQGGYYLGGITDGMADKVPARIDGRQEARLSDGEFVVPADVVSHLGNGNSNAGAQQLYAMMDKVRQERTGRKEQGRQINPKRFMPGMGA